MSATPYMKLFYDAEDTVGKLNDEEAGQLFKAILHYGRTGEDAPPASQFADLVYSMMKSQIDRDQDYINGKNGGRGNKKDTTKNPPLRGDKSEYVNYIDSVDSINNNSLSDNEDTCINEDSNVNEDNEVKDKESKGAAGKRFERFWKAYPKKVGKGAAEKAFAKYKPDDMLTDRMIRAVEEAKRSDQWRKDGGQYIPNPATWLNQKRWEDEPPDTQETWRSQFEDA